MESSIRFFNWAFKTRAETVIKLEAGEKYTPEKMFLSFCSHDPTLITVGSAGINASIKGIGFIPKPEYLEEVLEKEFMPHIRSYTPDDKTYGQRGLKVLIKTLYGEDRRHTMDMSRVVSLEMAKKHTYTNLLESQNSDKTNATLSFYQPPVIAYEVRGHAHMEENTLLQRFINAQHDMYHAPNVERWVTRPAIVFEIREIYDNSASRSGFGTQLLYPFTETL